MHSNEWKDAASCKDYDVNLFFDTYEEDLTLRPAIDSLCSRCPIARKCFAVGVSQKEYGIWGGVYLENGKISREFNNHKRKQDWGRTWEYLTIDKEK